MAIFKQIGRQIQIANAAAVEAGANTAAQWDECYRFRLPDADLFGEIMFLNNLILTNNSAVDAELRFGLNLEDGSPKFVIPANSTLVFTPADGIRFWAFDIMRASTATDIAIGEIQGMAWRTLAIPEV